MAEDTTYLDFLEIAEDLQFLECLKQQIIKINTLLYQDFKPYRIIGNLTDNLSSENTNEMNKKAIEFILDKLGNISTPLGMRLKMEVISSFVPYMQNKLEERLAKIMERMRKSENPECQKVVAFCQILSENISLYEAILMYTATNCLCQTMQSPASSSTKAAEEPPSGEEFPGTSGRRP
ncbi:MAG: hypothetical protein K2J20_04865 [Bacilli bacterium]|nr:hypothetical protein [Bacilli bacterium]